LDSPFFFESTTYWSDGDERAHFDWLAQIGCVREVRGEGKRVILEIDRDCVTADDARELNAIYRRFDGDLKQLEALEGSVG
jgi:hypothetical protein